MRGFLFVAASAETHEGGEFSVARGCLSSIASPQFPCSVPLAIVARVDFDFDEAGDHPFDIAFLDDDLQRVHAPIAGTIHPTAGSPFFHTRAVDLRLRLAKPGNLLFRFTVDGVTLYEARLHVSARMEEL